MYRTYKSLLVNTEYINYTRVKGVQIFGKALTSEEDTHLVSEAYEFCPDCHIFEYIKDTVKAIKVVPEEIIYLNSLDNGDRTKQILTKEHMTVYSDRVMSIH